MCKAWIKASASAYLWIAGIAFVLGRCSVTVPSAEVASIPASPSAAPLPFSDSPRGHSSLDRTETDAQSVYFRNCSAARAAGAAPIAVGEPGYASHLDRDGDGIACE
jgi:hypothetical protein